MEPSTSVSSARIASRAARTVEIGVLVIAFPLLEWSARAKWFWLDDFDFLADRRLDGSFREILGNLVVPHGDQLSTLQMVVYRGLYSIVGLHSYVPYVSVVIVFHLVAAWLLWRVMLRVGVNEWVAVVLSATFALFGAVAGELLFAALMNYTAALAFGLGQLLLADREGPIGRRDAGALLCGVLGLLCSGIALVLTAVVGMSLLLRHRWQRAAIQVVPVAVLFTAWQLAYGNTGSSTSMLRRLDFVGTGLLATVDGLTQIPYVGVVALVVVVAAFANDWLSPTRSANAIALSMALGVLAFFVVTGFGRAVFGASFAASDRYVYIGSALLLPCFGLVATRMLAYRFAPLALGVFGAWMLTANVVLLIEQPSRDRDFRRSKAVVTAAAALPDLGSLTPRQARIVIVPQLNFGGLAAMERDGAIPTTGADERTKAMVRGLLFVGMVPGAPTGNEAMPTAVLQTATNADVAVAGDCATLKHAKGGPLTARMAFPEAASVGVATTRSLRGSGSSHALVRLRWRTGPASVLSTDRPVQLRPGDEWTLRVSRPGYVVEAEVPEALDVKFCSLDTSQVTTR